MPRPQAITGYFLSPRSGGRGESHGRGGSGGRRPGVVAPLPLPMADLSARKLSSSHPVWPLSGKIPGHMIEDAEWLRGRDGSVVLGSPKL